MAYHSKKIIFHAEGALFAEESRWRQLAAIAESGGEMNLRRAFLSVLLALTGMLLTIGGATFGALSAYNEAISAARQRQEHCQGDAVHGKSPADGCLPNAPKSMLAGAHLPALGRGHW